MNNLGDFFGEIIAVQDGVNPNEVTSQYMHEQREKKGFPLLSYDAEMARYYSWSGRRFYSEKQWKEIERICDEALADV